MGISGDVKAKRRTLKILVVGIHPDEFGKMGAGFALFDEKRLKGQ